MSGTADTGTMREEPALTEFPSNWLDHLDALAGRITLDVAGYSTRVEVTKAQLQRVCFPLLAMLADLGDASREPGRPRPHFDNGSEPGRPRPHFDNSSEPGRPRPGFRRNRGGRVLAGLAGIPGGGKSTFAAVLSHVARHVLPPEGLVVVGMDGWHFPNAVLDQRTTRDAAGNVISLRQRKGAPESFDVAALAAALRELQAVDYPVSLPVYDRLRHDPVPDTLTVSPPTRVVLIEGNYLLSNTPPWNEVCALLRPRLWLECDPAIARERIIARHVRGGLNPEQAEAKYEINDRLNIETVLATLSGADYRIQLEPEPVVRSL